MAQQFEDPKYVELNILSTEIMFPIVTSLTSKGQSGLDSVMAFRNEIIRLYQANDYPSGYMLLRNTYNLYGDQNLDAAFIKHGKTPNLLRETILEIDNMIPGEANMLLGEDDEEYLLSYNFYNSYSLK